jgi:class 3 adenylate cyclase
VVLGWAEGDAAHEFAAFMRAAVSPDVDRLYTQWTLDLDVSALLAAIRPPTLILDRRSSWVGRDGGRETASMLPQAQLVFVEGNSLPTIGPAEPMARAIDAFLGDVEQAEPAMPPGSGALRTILFTDVEGSTSLTARLGDHDARAVLREHERLVREALRAHGGAEVKTLGDGFMAAFGSARQALACATAIQRAATAHAASGASAVRVRIGLNAGEPIAEDADLFGTAVNLAARIADAATGGEILVANVVRELAAGKGFVFEDRGELSLRGFAEPVRAYALRWEA